MRTFLYCALVLAFAGCDRQQVCDFTFQVTKTEDTADGLCGEDCSLREAVIAANFCPGPNRIDLEPGLYRLARANPDGPEDEAEFGDLDVSDDLFVIGVSQEGTVIDGNTLDRIFDIRAGNFKMLNVTLRNGVATGPPGAPTNGGAMRIAEASLVVLEDVTLTQNRAVGTRKSGGGIENRGDLSLNRVTLEGNAADGQGGGLYNWSTGWAFLRNVVFEGNTAALGGGAIFSVIRSTLIIKASQFLSNTADPEQGDGGAIWIGGTIDIFNSEFRNNSASSGGAIFRNRDNALTIKNSVFAQNQAESGGGAISSSGAVFLDNSVLEGNTAATGGALAVISGFLRIRESILRDNTAIGNGGAILAGTISEIRKTTLHNNTGRRGGAINVAGHATLFNVTLHGNTATDIGGAVSVEIGGVEALNAKNVTITDNVAPSAPALHISPFAAAELSHTVLRSAGPVANCAVFGAVTSHGFNLESDDSCGLTQPSDVQTTDPALGPLADNGGPQSGTVSASQTVPTRLPQPGSPLIDTGAPMANALDSVTEPGCLIRDQRGVARPQLGPDSQSVGCDRGAVEVRAGE